MSRPFETVASDDGSESDTHWHPDGQETLLAGQSDGGETVRTRPDTKALATAMLDRDLPAPFKGQYQAIKNLGQGNFGTCWLVRDLKNGQTRDVVNLVVKQIFIGAMASEDRDGVFKEADLLKALRHPYILHCTEAFREAQFLCIVTELCDQGDLSDRLEEVKESGKRLKSTQILEWSAGLASALKFIHEQHILHRDLKTKNIFLTKNAAKLGDFGIARVLDGTHDSSNTFAGTPYYMSPEALGREGYSAKADVWSLGCIIYEMCTLKQAFSGGNLMTVMCAICDGALPALPDSKPSTPGLKKLVASILVRDPEQRLSAEEVTKSEALKGYPKVTLRELGFDMRTRRSKEDMFADIERMRRNSRQEKLRQSNSRLSKRSVSSEGNMVSQTHLAPAAHWATSERPLPARNPPCTSWAAPPLF